MTTFQLMGRAKHKSWVLVSTWLCKNSFKYWPVDPSFTISNPEIFFLRKALAGSWHSLNCPRIAQHEDGQALTWRGIAPASLMLRWFLIGSWHASGLSAKYWISICHYNLKSCETLISSHHHSAMIIPSPESSKVPRWLGKWRVLRLHLPHFQDVGGRITPCPADVIFQNIEDLEMKL